ncbi:SpoIIE family protein phosphatase [Actinosynnema sp. NPDC059335]|uniref:SpoIIE family protein phosphatase n=1 Tax=Actinosynnema sp. NPDC059335 TaxID=3346804 RepID=UPI0036703A46
MARFDEGGENVFSADEEVGPQLASVDWAATPLGPPDGWPQSLRTAVSILLSSRFSMWMAWGPELTFFCNDAYRRDTLGRKYPWALGRPASEVWAEIWGDIGPRIDTVLTTGKATWDEALLLFLERSGYSEETYHTFSYSPLRDDSDAVVGMLCVVSEVTERVIGERRMATLRDLGSDPSVVRTEEETLAFSHRQLERNARDLPFTLTYLFGDDGVARLVGTTGITADHPAAPAALSADDPDPVWPVAAPAGGAAALVELEGEPFVDLPTGAWPAPPTRALVAPMQQQGGTPYGFVVVGLNRYRQVDEGYRGFLDLVAGHVAAGIASARSYQAQQRRAEELAELDRAKTAFFSNISHEFRTPLTLITGPLEELLDRFADDEPAKVELEAVHRNSLRLGKLVNTLLDFSRLEAGRMRARYEPLDLAVFTAELASVFRSAIERAGLRFEVDCPVPGEVVHVDRSMWEKVVLNLLSNALKFTFDGSIRVAVRGDGDHAVVTVADTGVGVAPDELPRLFERFHRIDNVRARSNEGSGIGLALVRELVGLHGGAITAESTPGRGTAFTIRLPLGADHLPADALVAPGDAGVEGSAADPFVQEALRWLPAEQTAADDVGFDGSLVGTPAATPAADGGRPPGRVLVADDNADMRDYLRRLLQPHYLVTAVGDGRTALDAVRAAPPDLVVSDVMMPGLDGLELVAALRADPRTASVPVLLLSARAGQEAAIEGLQAGADDYLFKPFSAAELLARVRANVELARMRNHHLAWRTALIDSLQEGFFVCDEQGAVVEVNAAFADLLGYGPEGLPYAARHPWWPDERTDPEAHRQAGEVFARLVERGTGTGIVPVTHRDGRRLWVAASFNRVADPDGGRHVTVGTIRDVTAEHHAVQRSTALAAVNLRLSRAEDTPDALRGVLEELRSLWHARRVLAATFERGDEPDLVSVGEPATWAELPEDLRDSLLARRAGALLTPVADGPTAMSITLEHPSGVLVLRVDLEGRRVLSAEDQTLLALLAGHLGQGLHRMRQIDQQRETALTLQRAMLGPARLPEGFAVRYEPATRPLKVGGDWYDTFELPDGRTAIVVGDCVGHGLQAAAVMGQLRSACRALLLHDPSPARTLNALDRFGATLSGAMCTTVFCAVLDTVTGDLVYSSAGHPPGIMVNPDGTTGLLDQGRGLPLAVRPDRPRPEATVVVNARATLLLYTDGLVERRRRPLDEGIAAVSVAVRAAPDVPVDDLATRIMTDLAPESGYDDDVALLVYRHPAPLEIAFPAQASELAPVRDSLRAWLRSCDVTAQQTLNILVAAGEACTNAIEHGHRDRLGGAIRLRASAFPDQVRLIVTDSGTWRTPDPVVEAHRGRGLQVMRGLVDDVTVLSGAGGTTVEMHARISQ